MSSSPWGKIQTVEPINLQDIMSEEVAKDLQAKEDRRYKETLNINESSLNEVLSNEVLHNEESNEGLLETACCVESDEVIAMMLQKQFDKEYDEMLKRTENKYNGDSKVSISYCNYRQSESAEDSDLDDEIVDIIDRKDWDRYDNVERSLSAIPRCGYKKQEDGKMVTKHDSTLSGRKNACKLLSFPPEFHTGDGAGFDLQLSNKVFNSLKAHSRSEQVKRYRMHDKREDRATAELGVDEFTCLILYKFINNGLLERVNGVISTGKEAIILHADSDPTYENCILPKECVIKVFKTTLSEFKQRDKYIKDDYRFKDRFGKQNSKKMVSLWAEKEMHNLLRIQKAGIPCPEVIALKKHVLVMSFIGENNRPATKLKDSILDDASMIMAYDMVVDTMKKLYKDANLVHADLSEYNILWHDGQCWFIDVGQSVEPSHPNAHIFLFRDCSNISTFFDRKGVPDVKDPENLFTEITGFKYRSDNPSSLSKDNQKRKPHLVDRSEEENSNHFEYEWAKSKEEINNKKFSDITTEINNLILVEQPAA